MCIVFFISILPITLFAKTSSEIVCEISSSFRRSLEIIGANIANHKTTRTIEGGSYIPKDLKCVNSDCQVVNSAIASLMVYEPGHPDANANGYVSYPNIDLQLERTKFQLMAERLISLAKKKECGMSLGEISSDSLISIYYGKKSSSTDVFIKNSQGEIIIWQSLSNNEPGTILNLIYGKSSSIPASGSSKNHEKKL